MARLKLKHHRSPFLFTIIGIYVLSNFLMLINGGVFWDDWILYDMPKSTVLQVFTDVGAPYIGVLHNFLNSFDNPVFMYRVITLSLQIASVLILNRILVYIRVTDKYDRFYVLMLFALVPFYASKVTLIMLPATLSYAIFIFAFYLLMRYLSQKLLYLRLLSLMLFFVSFSLNSLLVFYAVPIYFLVSDRSPKKLFDFKISYYIDFLRTHKYLKILDFLLLPFIFWVVKKLAFPLGGAYLNKSYNELSIKALLKFPLRFLETVKNSFLGVFSEFYSYIAIDLFYGLLFIGVLMVGVISSKFIFSNRAARVESRVESSKKFLVVGFIVFLLGSLPYILVKKIPSFEGYETRHQVLLSLGFSLLMFGFLLLIKNNVVRRLFFYVTISVFVTCTLAFQLQYLKGWLKQEAIHGIFAKELTEDTASLIIVHDSTKVYNATSRDIAFYNYNGIAKKATGLQQFFIIEQEEYDSYLIGETTYEGRMEAFNMQDYEIGHKAASITFSFGDTALDVLTTLRLSLLYHTDLPLFEQQVESILSYEINE
ncbi:hypothetical protein OB69_08210 [Roseivirga seohaensis subsp. aquiponti]|uniref:Glycosyltransferase RgtA/B/C/D-like domain-containing protein n=2 Tax=Roseivirga TaxID=290180 RepID=A0A0L8AM68_9BACT|nr:hypothetical protein [Roseivirga seohaensis]KOF03270.1 hypothetical protein OB69_08210 [Roseivirga seohaensis subsp. aquiponti]|tara:strand:- start:127476 stop:129092 length:1617 start_codon:yes stop_codon:yes gene_type:complete